MDESKARAIAQAYLDTLERDPDGGAYRTTQARAFAHCWIISWRLFQGDDPVAFMPPGSAPLLVDNAAATVLRIGSAPAPDAWARYYDVYRRLGAPAEVMQFSLAAEPN